MCAFCLSLFFSVFSCSSSLTVFNGFITITIILSTIITLIYLCPIYFNGLNWSLTAIGLKPIIAFFNLKYNYCGGALWEFPQMFPPTDTKWCASWWERFSSTSTSISSMDTGVLHIGKIITLNISKYYVTYTVHAHFLLIWLKKLRNISIISLILSHGYQYQFDFFFNVPIT